MHNSPPVSKVYYRPIEAAIRWAGLLKHKKDILRVIPSPRHLPMTFDLPGWAGLRLCTERIYDAIFNGELPFGRDGITQNDSALWDSPDLTVRHLDLKRWIRDHYPEERPAFLFSHRERIVHPIITLEAGQAMLVERQALKVELAQCRHQFQALQDQHQLLSKQIEATPACNECSITDRAEATYLHVIGAMLDLMLGQSPAGTSYSSFRTQEAIAAIHEGLATEIVRSRAEIFHIYVGQHDIARQPIAFTPEGQIKRQGHKTLFSHLGGVEIRRLFFRGTKRVAHDDGRMPCFPVEFLRNKQVSDDRHLILVFETYFLYGCGTQHLAEARGSVSL